MTNNNPHAEALLAARDALEDARQAARDRGRIGIGVELDTLAEQAAMTEAVATYLAWNDAPIVEPAPRECPDSTSGAHLLYPWSVRPATVWVGGSDFGGQDTPAHEYTECQACGERFTR